MRLESFADRDKKLKELVTTTPTSNTPGTITTGGNTQQSQGQQAGLATGQMDPVQAAQAARQRQEQKKQIQDQIRATEKQLIDLRKQLAGL